MYICPNCKKTTEEQVRFCSECGTQMVEAVPQPVQPTQPIYYSAPANQVPLGKVITGMALGIAGVFFAGLNFLYTVMFLGLEAETAFIFAFVMSIFSLPPSIIGLVFSKSNIEAGSASGMCRAGKICGLIGVILTGVALTIGFIGLA